MDNLTHTLVGVALGEAGLRRRTRLATATLAIGANLPDVDALIYLVGSDTDALAFRRGHTHGVLAMLVLPLLLVGAMLLYDRWRPRADGDPGPPTRPGALLFLAALAVWSHPLLDWLNVYGVRLLMPFSDRWFYGDALFIIDPWVWLALGIGVFMSRRRMRKQSPAPHRPAQIALLVGAAYLLAMIGSSRVGEAVVVAQARDEAEATMIAPVPVSPVSRYVVRELPDGYETGTLRFDGAPRYEALERQPVGDDLTAAMDAAATGPGRNFLSWARFPRFESWPEGDSVRVRISDMRYGTGREAGFAVVEVVVGR